MRRNHIFLTALLILSAVSFISCKRDKDDPAKEAEQTENIQSARDYSEIESEMTAVYDMAEAEAAELYSSGDPSNTPAPACAVVSYDTSVTDGDGMSFTIDFGSTPCLCADGISRQGSIHGEFTGSLHSTGASYTVTVSNYISDNVSFSGSMNMQYTGSGGNDIQYTWTISNVTATYDQTSVSFSSTRTIQRISGGLTTDPLDDVFTITGSSSGTNQDGVSYTAAITTPVRIELSCHYIVSGVIEISNDGGKTMSLNYDPSGNGGCDDQASVSVGAFTKTITLRAE